MDADEERFTAIYDTYRMRVWAYAASRAGSQAADEVVSDTFMVAWRRFPEMPSAPLPWLLGVARNVVRESVRAETRRDSLNAEIRRWGEESVSDVADGVVDRIAIRRALAQLPESDREVLILVAWQGLSPREAARVVGCTATAFRVRLHRARRRLEAAVRQLSPERTRRPSIELEVSP